MFRSTKKIPKISFSPETRVRNLYETTNPETGELNVTLNEYNVNATKNINMPGYSMNKAKFTPHSKSSLQRAITEMGKNSIGWQPAIGSVGNNAIVVDKASAYRNMQMMKNLYGDKWVTASVIRESANKQRQEAEAEAYTEFLSKMEALEKKFFELTGIRAPTILARETEEKLGRMKLRMNHNEFMVKRQKVLDELNEVMASIPQEDLYNFDLTGLSYKDELVRTSKAAEKLSKKIALSAPIGKRYPLRRPKMTLKNRLSAASSAATAAAVALAKK